MHLYKPEKCLGHRETVAEFYYHVLSFSHDYTLSLFPIPLYAQIERKVSKPKVDLEKKDISVP